MGASWLMSPIMMNMMVTAATTTIEYIGTLLGPRWNKKNILINRAALNGSAIPVQ